jgi:hypothetical protein
MEMLLGTGHGEKTALIRVRAGISYALAEAMDEGHCGLPVEEFVTLTEKLLEVTAELVETALNLELESGAVIADDLKGRRCVFLAALYRAEREIGVDEKAQPLGRERRRLRSNFVAELLVETKDHAQWPRYRRNVG